jgi:predicted ArsR family transcriptional regulator
MSPVRDPIAAADAQGALDAITALGDVTRRALYDLVVASAAPVSRDEAADALGLTRGTAAFHLDRLVTSGALEVEYRRLSGRTGPGSGRPAKLYRRAAAELSVSLPPRAYDLAGELLATAIERADRSGESVRDALDHVAEETGRELGAGGKTLEQTLGEVGYEPRDDGAGGLALVNCPFHRLAASHTEVICATNVCLIQGIAQATGERERDVVFAPDAESCCVRITRRHPVE